MISSNFIKYFLVGIIAVIVSTTLLIILVDYMGIWLGIANPMAVSVVFVMKYFLYDKVGMLSENEKRLEN